MSDYPIVEEQESFALPVKNYKKAIQGLYDIGYRGFYTDGAGVKAAMKKDDIFATIHDAKNNYEVRIWTYDYISLYPVVEQFTKNGLRPDYHNSLEDYR